MKNEKITIDFNLDTNFVIFQEPKIENALNNLFENMSKTIFERFRSISTAIEVKENNEFSNKELFKLFKFYFKKEILNQAILMALQDYRYNLFDNVYSLISESVLNAAIHGDIMLETFIATFRTVKASTEFERAIIGSKIITLEKIYDTI